MEKVIFYIGKELAVEFCKDTHCPTHWKGLQWGNSNVMNFAHVTHCSGWSNIKVTTEDRNR